MIMFLYQVSSLQTGSSQFRICSLGVLKLKNLHSYIYKFTQEDFNKHLFSAYSMLNKELGGEDSRHWELTLRHALWYAILYA